MKLNKLSLAVAAACGIAAVPAHALLANQYTNSSEFAGDTTNIRVSGATAQDAGLLASALRYCTAGSLTRYAIANNFVYFCTANTGQITTRPGAPKVAFYKYSVGGSGSGVQPVNDSAPLPFLDLTKLSSSCAGASSVADADGAGPLPTYQDIACSASSNLLTTAAVSYIGLSDVEPSFFGPPTTFNNLASGALATVIFGVPVSQVAYEYLQARQSLTVGSVDVANLPSLTQAQLTSMYTQPGQTWANLFGVPLNGANDLIYVARRVDSSGTQKTFEAVIARTTNGTSTGKSCQVNVEPFVTPEVVAADNTAVNTACNGSSVVVAGSGSGQVAACLARHNQDGRGAIGILTTESKQTAAGGWRFVKVNGIAPTHAGVASGAYTQYSDAALNTRVNAVPAGDPRNSYTNFLTRLRTDFADPIVIAVINAGPQPFGNSGLMALDALNPALPAADYSGASGRNPWSRLVGGSILNNCQPGKAAAF